MEQLAPCALEPVCFHIGCSIRKGETCKDYASEDDLKEMAESDKRCDAWHDLKEYEQECKLAMKRSEK